VQDGNTPTALGKAKSKLTAMHQSMRAATPSETLANYFTFMLPRILIDLFLNNQADALIIQIYSVIKLYMFRASSLSIIRSFLLYIRHW